MLALIDIHKDYEGKPLLNGISFEVKPGATVCLLGASGSGKSTLLRIIAGLETPERGQVRWNGSDLSSVPAHRRNFGLVFQDYALFPHLNVFDNVAFALRLQGLPAGPIIRRVEQVLAQVNLGGFALRRVTDLSGGEQQRVALARALAPNPRLLMFDEPLGALDRALREHLLGELRNILRQTGVPAIYVTHDQDEAFTIADTIILLKDGRIAQLGAPEQVFANPASAWVAEFLGLGNVVQARLSVDGRLETAWGWLRPREDPKPDVGGVMQVLVRPSGARLAAGAGENVLTGEVSDVIFRNESFRVTLAGGLYVDLPKKVVIGQKIFVTVPPSAVQCLP